MYIYVDHSQTNCLPRAATKSTTIGELRGKRERGGGGGEEGRPYVVIIIVGSREGKNESVCILWLKTRGGGILSQLGSLLPWVCSVVWKHKFQCHVIYIVPIAGGLSACHIFLNVCDCHENAVQSVCCLPTACCRTVET